MSTSLTLSLYNLLVVIEEVILCLGEDRGTGRYTLHVCTLWWYLNSFQDVMKPLVL